MQKYGKIYLFSIEECILESKKALKNKEFLNQNKSEKITDDLNDKKFSLICPKHENSPLSIEKMTPDVGFLDLTAENIVSPKHIRRGTLVGRGAFGFVFNGFVKQPVFFYSCFKFF